jgi:hypothetical protein
VPFSFGDTMKTAKLVLSFSELSAARASLVRLCQAINFGLIQDLEVRASDPVLDPQPKILVDIKLDSDCEFRPEAHREDFVLPKEVGRLMAHFDELQNCHVQQIEVRAGVPRRVIFGYPALGARDDS